MVRDNTKRVYCYYTSIKLLLKSNREALGPVLTVDVCAKVDLANVVIAQYGRIAGIGGVVGGTVVDGTAGREG